jgi:hypothetical protein
VIIEFVKILLWNFFGFWRVLITDPRTKHCSFGSQIKSAYKFQTYLKFIRCGLIRILSELL